MTKMWQMPKSTWHHFGGKINWFWPPPAKTKAKTQRRAHDLENQDAI